MKYDDRHTIKAGSNGHTPSRAATAASAKTNDSSKNVSATPASAAPLDFRKNRRFVLFALVWLAWQREDSGCENGGRLAGLLRLPMMRL